MDDIVPPRRQYSLFVKAYRCWHPSYAMHFELHYKNVHSNSNLITCAHMFFLSNFVGIFHNYTFWSQYRSYSSYHRGMASNTYGMKFWLKTNNLYYFYVCTLLLNYNLNNFDSCIYFMCFDFTNRRWIVLICIGLSIVYFWLHI